VRTNQSSSSELSRVSEGLTRCRLHAAASTRPGRVPVEYRPSAAVRQQELQLLMLETFYRRTLARYSNAGTLGTQVQILVLHVRRNAGARSLIQRRGYIGIGQAPNYARVMYDATSSCEKQQHGVTTYCSARFPSRPPHMRRRAWKGCLEILRRVMLV